MQEAQAKVSDFIAQHRLTAGAGARLLDLQSELGELAKEYLIASDYGRGDFAANAAWTNEIGDVAFSLLALAAASEVDLQAALDSALVKYAGRLAGGATAGSGLLRAPSGV
jgi:NTP pyrophosphatase (non-canonical NTP hydrolase)